MDHIVHICITTDKNYLELTKMCINDIILAKATTTILYFYILGNNVDLSELHKFEQYSDVHVTTYTDNFDTHYSFYNNYRHLTSTVYVRTLIPILPVFDKIDKVLYLDADILAKKDLFGFYNENITGRAMGVVKDFGMANVYNTNPIDLSTFSFFNTGQLLMNLPYLRNINFTEECAKLMHTKGMTDDQPIINKVLVGKVKYLSPIYFFPWHKTKTMGGNYNNVDLWNKTYGTSFRSMQELEDASVLWHFHGEKEAQLKNPILKQLYQESLDRVNTFFNQK